MDSEIKKFGTLLEIGNQVLLHWIVPCPLIFVCLFLLTLPIGEELEVTDMLNSDVVVDKKDLEESLLRLWFVPQTTKQDTDNH